MSVNTNINPELIKRRYVIDTNALISSFSSIFDVSPQVSSKGLSIIHKAFQDNSDCLAIIPSVVFVHIFTMTLILVGWASLPVLSIRL